MFLSTRKKIGVQAVISIMCRMTTRMPILNHKEERRTRSPCDRVRIVLLILTIK